MDIDMKSVVEESFIQYSGAVLQSRALPDVRDCLKPSARQIFYANYTDNFTHNKPYKKTIKAIGSAMRFYIHGDSSCEGVIMRASQPFSFRYPLVEVDGSFGTLTQSGNWAAPRYTSSRLTEFSDLLFGGIKKNTIDEWRDNYDDTEKYPAVVPSIGFYNIVNGSLGIGVGAAGSIPTFNLKEVNTAIAKLIRNDSVPFEDIVCYPDFPSGGIILNKNEVYESLKNGTGKSCKIRSVIEYSPEENCLIATEIPYSVYTNTICSELEEILNENKCPSIERFNDLTGEKPKIKIYLKKGTNPKRVEQFLYKNTSLEYYYPINMTMLKDGRFPQLFGWKEALLEYINHIRVCKTKEIIYDRDKALARKNIIEGLLIAIANIDEVVSIIRHSDSPAIASEKLIQRFRFNEAQTKAILAMKLSSLTKIDGVKIEDEKKELESLIADLTYLLENKEALDEKLIEILEEVSRKFNDPRRSKIINIIDNDDESTVEVVEESVAVMLFDNNMFRVVRAEDMNGGKRGKKGVNLKPPRGAMIINTLYTTNLASIACFSNLGRMYSFSVDDVEYDMDYSIYDMINLQNDSETIITMLDSTSFFNYKHIIFITKNGMIKKSSTSDYRTRSKKGIVAIKLKEDTIINVYLSSNEEDEIMIASDSGNYVRFNQGEIATTGKASSGVKAISLGKNGKVVSTTIIRKNLEYIGVLTISANGKGKITKMEDFSKTSRAVKGPKAHNIEKDESLSVVYAVEKNKTKLNIMANNKMVTIQVNEIPIQGKLTSGVKIIRVNEGFNEIEVR